MSKNANGYSSNMMFDFIEAMKIAETPHAIARSLEVVAGDFGLDSFAISGLPLPGESIAPYVLLNGWPPEWFERYVAEKYVRVDPVIHHSRTTDEVFIWSEVLNGTRVGPRARKLMNEASDFGMRDGISVPLHSIGGLQAIVTFGGRNIKMPQEAKGILHLVSIYAHHRLQAITKKANGTTRKKVANLTTHERDVIYWCAEGKTNWEIAQILGRSKSTVQHQLRNALLKLNCVNRSQLIATSIRHGLIR